MRQLFLQQGALRMSEAQFSIAEPQSFLRPETRSSSVKRLPSTHPTTVPAAIGGEPRVVGNECSGTVVAVGGGISTIGLLGREVLPCNEQWAWRVRRVCLRRGRHDVDGSPGVAVEDACGFFVNPFTAYAILEEAKARKQKYLIHTAAVSVLGQMLAKASRIYGVTVVHIVRRQEQAALLRDLGRSTYSFTREATRRPTIRTSGLRCVSSSKTIPSRSPLMLSRARCRVCFAALPPRSTVFVYGRLASNFVDGLPVTDTSARTSR